MPRHWSTSAAPLPIRKQSHRALKELTNLGLALSTERDLMTLLEMILSQARRITSSDAGSLYLTDRTSDGTLTNTLRFMLSQNHTIPALPLTEFTVPVDHSSLAGYAAATGEPLVIARRLSAPRRRHVLSRTEASTRSSAIAPNRCSSFR